MTNPTGPSGTDPQGSAPAQSGWGAPAPQPGYGAPAGEAPGYGQAYPPAPSPSGGYAGASPTMAFPDAVRSALTQYVTFTGRARRSEYWWFALFNLGLSVVAMLLDLAIGAVVLQAIVALGLLLPSLAVGVRRLHDTGRSGWWLLIALVPLVGPIVLIVFMCTDSEPGSNAWGISPKFQGAGPRDAGY